MTKRRNSITETLPAIREAIQQLDTAIGLTEPGEARDITQALCAIKRDLYDIRDEIAWNHNPNDHLNATPR